MAKNKIQKSVYISEKSDKYIKAHMKAHNISNYSAALEDAIEYAFDPAYRDEREAELTKRVSQFGYSLNEHRKKTARDLKLTHELLANLLYETFKRMPPVPDEVEEVRNTEALSLLDKTMKNIMLEMPKSKGMEEEE